MELPPVDLQQQVIPEFRRVATQGTYQHSKAVFVGPRPLSYDPSDWNTKQGMREVLSIPGAIKSGFLLITPLSQPGSQHAILVNRGWVPPSWKADWQQRSLGQQPLGLVKVSGVVQGSEKPSSFVPANEPQQGSYFWLDVPGIAEACGLPADTPMVQVLLDEGLGVKGEQPTTTGTVFPLPKPLSRVVHFSTMPIGHFNYVVGWTGMSAAMAYLALKVLHKGRR
eukprot:GHRR01003339.1.p1 GENE.GHRR01003339.1~~GHRR01003339.1.p1  ORF type:complete len:224 (+),score=77.29 GHRR01003339.1:3723-4394(+)